MNKGMEWNEYEYEYEYINNQLVNYNLKIIETLKCNVKC